MAIAAMAAATIAAAVAAATAVAAVTVVAAGFAGSEAVGSVVELHVAAATIMVDTIKICNGYRADGHELDRFPSNTDLLAQCEPVYEDFPGWDTPTSGATTWEALPENAQNYVRRIQDLVGCPVQIISTGPNREETILLDPIIA